MAIFIALAIAVRTPGLSRTNRRCFFLNGRFIALRRLLATIVVECANEDDDDCDDVEEEEDFGDNTIG
ncbi:hypothetical protein QR98_0052110 [Sarcoptes scabiei]|uniref:Uncharacterized protein n=1 Tax=Sarcoptes scabiei TaxID=52283 RepID=A0A132A6Y3_SARSC|nr:hypothetical protein QR98_0052110 [Sarcoptes scabiei]